MYSVLFSQAGLCVDNIVTVTPLFLRILFDNMVFYLFSIIFLQIILLIIFYMSGQPLSLMSVTPMAKRLRFTYDDDLLLLREVVSNNPFKNPELWEEIAKKLELLTRKKFSIRTLKHHLDLLIDLWLKKDEIDKVRSGIEEPISEKDELLREASMLNFEFKSKGTKRKIPTKEQTITDIGKKVRDKYSSIFNMEKISTDTSKNNSSNNFDNTDCIVIEEHNYTQSFEIPDTVPVELEAVNILEDKENENISMGMQEENEPSTSGTSAVKPRAILTENNGKSCNKTPKKFISGPKRTRQKRDPGLRKNALSYLTEKEERGRDLRQKEIELEYKKVEIEERKLALEEARLEMERNKNEIEFKEREQRIKIEMEKAELEAAEKKTTFQLLHSQQALIEKLLSKNQNVTL